MARYIMIIVLGGLITYGISNISLNDTVNRGTQNSVDNFSYNRAHDIANSMADILLMRIADDGTYRVKSPTTEDLFGGEATYTVEDAFFENDSLIKVSVTSNFNGIIKNVSTYTRESSDGWVPSVIRAAWTANGPLNKTISDMYIDGRDYAILEGGGNNKTINNGDKKKKKKKKKKGDGGGGGGGGGTGGSLYIIPGSGVYGVSTSINFVNFENGAIGGTKDSVDYPMTFPENPNVIEENYNWSGTFPTSPDEILGYPEGTLKAYAKNGENGSFYTTNPKDLEKRTLSGVTYVELAPGKDEKIKLMDGIHKGVLIIHNKWGNSRIAQSKISNGRFEGIIVGDYMFHFHIDVLGAIILLSSNLETEKNCNGNLDHKVFYSSQTIKTAIGDIAGTLGGPPLYGFAKKRLLVKHWYE